METPHPFRDASQPAERHCAVFDTALGAFGIAWRDEAVSMVLRPLLDREATVTELQWQSAAEVAPPPWPEFVAHAVAAMRALLEGRGGAEADLRGVPLDWAGIGQFERRVYEAARDVAFGHTCTYEELAQAMGSPGAARAVDVALARNPWPLIVPCHRIVAGGGRLGGAGAPGGPVTKHKLLAIEAAGVARAGAPGPQDIRTRR